MTIAFGVVVLLLSLLGWLGQVLTVFSPRLAVALGVTEPASDVDAVFHADGDAEAVWDALTLWTLPLAATLLIMAAPSWPLFGLVGGGTFLYFAGRGIAQRLVMSRRDIRIGTPSTLRTAFLFLALWGLAGGATIGLASATLLGRM